MFSVESSPLERTTLQAALPSMISARRVVVLAGVDVFFCLALLK